MEGYLPLLFIVVMFLGFYFLMVRPAAAAEGGAPLVAELAVGQEVMTTAGIYGTLSAVGDDTVELGSPRGACEVREGCGGADR